MHQLNLKPAHKPVRDYYAALNAYSDVGAKHEMAVRSAFQNLLSTCAGQFKWTLVPEYPIRRPHQNPLKVDGATVDTFRMARGFWEAKDERDDLEREVKQKFAAGYPKSNIIFQAPERAILYQNGMRVLDEDITRPDTLVQVVRQFFEYEQPHHRDWEDAVAEFKQRVPELATRAKELIEDERRKNKKFVASFEAFHEVCRQSINPQLSEEAVEKMLIQHLLTERIFRKIFDNPDFTRRNVVAAEIERVIDSLTSRAFNRDAFLRDLDRFYKAIEQNAEAATDYSEKQSFLNTVYERFFQGYSPKEADTHGIVYTPQPIVDFMVRSVEDILQREFGRSLSDKGVHILDPFVGTGNFITRVIKEIKGSALEYKYENELHCNEVMLLPYYIASMNIEHAYMERMGEYRSFLGICLVDTFELAEPKQSSLGFMNEENTARVQRQKEAPIFVVIGNPPYNVGQMDENDENKNRKYKTLDRRLADTYGADSKASSLTKLHDPYVKALRWASDRIQADGVVALVSNSSFVDQIAFDGVRANLEKDFDSIYILDLGGNVRKNPKISGTTHNVFGIQVGVSIEFLIRRSKQRDRASIYYSAVNGEWRREQKYAFLDERQRGTAIEWTQLRPDARHTWLTADLQSDFETFLPLGSKEKLPQSKTVFALQTLGVSTNRDTWAYNFTRDVLERNVRRSMDFYNAEVDRFKRERGERDVDRFVQYDDKTLAWSRDLKADLKRGRAAVFDTAKVRRSLYRPFTAEFLFFDRVFNEEVYRLFSVLPCEDNEAENCLIWVKQGTEVPLFALTTNFIPNLLPQGGSQCFPFYTYDEDGTNRRENITDWALEQFRAHYKDPSITKWDIFHYTYAVVHHPTYRERYAANLKRELPRIPFVEYGDRGQGTGDSKSVFRAFVEAGRRLAELHVKYEEQPEYPLEKIENPQTTVNWRVEKMRLSKDKATLLYNEWLTLKGIPPETYEYRLGNRSALEWVVDQYQVSTDKRSGITNDPNREDDAQYIVRLIGQVIHVSLETMKVVKALPELVVDQGKVTLTRA